MPVNEEEFDKIDSNRVIITDDAKLIRVPLLPL